MLDKWSGRSVSVIWEEEKILPNFCSVHMMLIVILLAELLCVVLVMSQLPDITKFWSLLAIKSIFVQWIVVLSLFSLCFFSKYLNRLSPVQAYIGAGFVIVFVAVFLVFMLYFWVDFLPKYFSLPDLNVMLVSVGSIAAIMSFIIMRYFYVQAQWRMGERARVEARMQSLQSRIRPHFLFNSMNTIAALTRSDPALAEQTVLDLADLFRAGLSSVERKGSLKSELQLAQGYLRIEQQRLGQRLKVIWDIEEIPKHIQMPSLILQPLVENAVYHGIEPSTTGGEVTITIRYRRLHVNISIVNPLSEQKSNRKGNNMAMENVQLRLHAFFGGEAKLISGMVDGLHQVRIVFPHPWVV